MTGPIQPKDHSIPLTEAAKMIARHRSQATVQGTRAVAEGEFGGAFTKKGILDLLKSDDCAYLRFYYARDDAGRRHLVLVGADQQGNDIVDDVGDGKAAVLDQHWPCPPFCPPSASTLRDRDS
jgi:hypothetical protein